MQNALRFGRFEIRPAERLLLDDGVPADLGARAFDVLLCLISHRDRVVTKEEALQSAWPGRVVEENNLSVQVSAVRRVIGSKAIATVPGIGYRFTVPIGDPGASPSADPHRGERIDPQPRSASAEAAPEASRHAVTQRIQFAPARSGLRLAYAISGSGYPVVRAPHWLTHLEADWQTPVWRRLLTDLSSRYTVVRFDQSGTGLSDSSVAASTRCRAIRRAWCAGASASARKASSGC